jgi:hypothetical protein
MALIVGGVLEEKNRAELSRCAGHLDLYRWLQSNGFLNEQRGLIEAYKSGKMVVMVGDKPTSQEHAFVSKLHQSGILSKIEESKKEVDSITTLTWAIAVGEDIQESKFVSLGWEASAFDLYREMEKNGFIDELRPLACAYNSGMVSNYSFVRQLHQTSILSKIQESGREVFSYVTLTNALVSGEIIPYDRKAGLHWVSSAFDIFIVLTEDKNISTYLHDYCDVLNSRIEGKEISPAQYALHISLLHDSVNQILNRAEREISATTFFHALVSGGIVPESLEYLITCAIGAKKRAESLALRELYKSSSSFADFYRKMMSNWHSLRESLQSTYTNGATPEKPFSNSYAWKIWSALSAMEATF